MMKMTRRMMRRIMNRKRMKKRMRIMNYKIKLTYIIIFL